MYRILNSFAYLQDGTAIMTFDGIATKTSQNYVYQFQQDLIIFKNNSDFLMTVTVNNVDYPVKSGTSATFTAVTEFSAVATVPFANQFFTVFSRTASSNIGGGGGGGGSSSDGTIINVKSGPYNARGDGETDDTAAINRAIAAVPAGGTLKIPAGTYMINAGNPYNPLNEGLTLQLKSDMRVEMSEATVLKVIPNNFNNYAVFLLRDIDNVTIEGGILIGERYAHTFVDPDAQGGMGVWLHAASNVTIRDTTFKEFMGDGIYTRYHDTLGNTKDVSVENCTFIDNRRQGISICANDGFRVLNNYFYGTFGAGGHDPGAGVDIEPELGGTVKNVVISSNIFKENKIGIQGLGQSGAVISDNIFDSNTMWGVYLADTAFCSITGNKIFGSGDHGIYLNFANDSTITGNTIYSNGNYGIFLLNDCNRNVINGNRCYQNTQYGIGLYNADDCVVADNSVSNNSLVGIDVSNSIGTIVSNNKTFDNARSGINLWKVKDTLVEGNQATNNAQHGIVLKGDAVNDSIDNVIRDNHCKGNGQEVTNFYQNIALMSTADNGIIRTTIDGNMCRAGDNANKPQFGIYISTGTQDTYLVLNDTRLGGASGGVSDNGVGSINPDTGKPDPTIDYSAMGLPFKRTVSDSGVGSYVFAGLAYDLFDRADSVTSLGSMNAGGTYTVIGTAVAGIISNKAYFVTDADGDTVINTTDISTSNYAVTCTVSGDMTSFSNYRNPQLLARYIDGNNFVRSYAMGGWLSLEAKVDGANVNWGQIQLPFTNGTDYKFKVAINGGNVKLYLDGVLKIEYNMSSAELTKFGTNKKIGLRLAKSGTPTSIVRFDNLVVEST